MNYAVLINRYFWALCIFIAALNTVILWWRVQPTIKADPSLRLGYRRLLLGYWLVLTLPWIVMGVGIVFGNVPTIWHFLYLNTGNLYVLAWWVVYWLIHAVLAYWILVGNGATTLIAYPGLLRGRPQNPKVIKLFVLLAVVVAIGFTTIMAHSSATELPFPSIPA